MQHNREWISTTDLMSVLMMVFLFIAIAFMQDINQQKEEVKEMVKVAKERGIMVIILDRVRAVGTTSWKVQQVRETSIMENPIKEGKTPEVTEGEQERISIMYGSKARRERVLKVLEVEEKTQKINNMYEEEAMTQEWKCLGCGKAGKRLNEIFGKCFHKCFRHQDCYLIL